MRDGSQEKRTAETVSPFGSDVEKQHRPGVATEPVCPLSQQAISPADSVLPRSARWREGAYRGLEIHTLGDDAPVAWDQYVYAHADGTIFHTLAWRDAVRQTFGHAAYYLMALKAGAVQGVLPLFLVDSRWAGRMLVSVPYAVGGGALALDDDVALPLVERARQIALARGCGFIDLRSENRSLPGFATTPGYVGFRRTLPDQPEAVWKFLPRKARAAARNGRDKFGLRMVLGDEHLPAVWHLYARNMRRLGSINYPRSFLERLAALTQNHHWVSLAVRRSVPVAGLMSFVFKDTVLPYFFGASRLGRRCCAANFLYAAMMEHAVREGCRVFDFGRSRVDNAGSFNFKKFQGFEPRPLHYQVVPVSAPMPVRLSPDDPRFRIARRIWRYLPLFVTKHLGACLARHIPG